MPPVAEQRAAADCQQPRCFASRLLSTTDPGRSRRAARVGNVRVELKCSNGKELFPCALIRAWEQSVRAEIPKAGFSSTRALGT
jgi:hypothetical protein